MHDFNFKCMRCSAVFKVQLKYMIAKDSLVCPNCGDKLPDNVFEKLKTVADSLKEYEESQNENQPHFQVTIQ